MTNLIPPTPLPDIGVQTAPQSAPSASGTAAIVVTYNRKALLNRCLTLLLGQTAAVNHIYVIDNASTDGTAEIIPNDPRITHVRLQRNLGGAYGFSYGVEQALRGNYQHLWLMDDDCLPEAEALAELLTHTAESEALCSAVLARDGRYDLHQRRSFDEVRLSEIDLPKEAYAKPGTPVDLFTFVSVLISTDAVRRAGLPVNNFFFMYDDSEYALRLRDMGVTTRLVPSSRVWHYGSLTYPPVRTAYNPLKHYYNTRNQLLVYRQYGTSAPWFLVRLLVKTGGAFIRLAQHRELNRRSAGLAARALLDAVRGRAYVRPIRTN
ncbi:glycosyltransferase [Deinococcus sp. Arct2-2]|uniref:glycosyltransferase n=1 Tax=Deinococcus sp. Arct2-2 TaxID=2568653 RepID=UPI0010A4C5B9|nr:glycosyltransferase [Deinococcus sp. Arct2-2]THF71490.1 glycosyltransferase [Deinococcus sp. Arct2-2]